MPFTSIVSGSNTFAPREPGVYALSTLGFSAPQNEIRLKGYSKNRDGSLSGSTTYLLEKDVTVAGVTVRRSMRLVLQGTLTTDFTAAEVIAGVKAIYDHHNTAGNTDRQLQGEA
nr:MAG: hypothetical protein 2 [Hangzhou steitz-like virus 8]